MIGNPAAGAAQMHLASLETEGTIAPVVLHPQLDIAPREYVVHRHFQQCTNCGHKHHFTQVYALYFMKARYGMGALVKNLIPVHSIVWNVPVRLITVAKGDIPICHECYKQYAFTDHPSPPAATNLTVFVLENTDVVDAKPQSRNGAAQTPKNAKAKTSKRFTDIKDFA